MQENDFEKQVQQKMEELQFVPSEPVWQKVALQIGKEKRKRRLVFMLLPLLLATGGVIWLATQWNNKSSEPITNQQHHQTAATNSQQHKPVEKILPTDSSENKLTAEAQTAGTSFTNKTIRHTDKKKQKGIETFSARAKKEINIKADDPTTALSQMHKRSGINEDLHALILENEIQKKESEIAAQKAADEKNVSKSFWNSSTAKEVTAISNLERDSIVNSPTDDVQANRALTQKDSARVDVNEVTQVPTPIKPLKKEKAWEWTVTARGGASHLRNTMLNVFSAERADNSSASPWMGNNPSTGSGGNMNNNPALISSGKIEKSFALSLGAGVRKKILPNAFVVVGLQYSRYSTQSTVGTEVMIDSTVNYYGRPAGINSYYRVSGPQKDYTTHFHYLEMPLAFEYRLFKKLPLQLQHGISAGYLFTTNALYYHPTGIMYQHNAWLRKVAINVFTSVDYRLLQTPSFSLFLGPQVQWSLSPLQQPQETKRHYLFFTGVQSRITF